MTNSLAIIGAGIGGLTTALTLKKIGFNATVYESATQIKPVGAGIIIASNAMQVFKKLGIQQKIELAGNKISYLKITDEQFRDLSVMNLSSYERKYRVHHIAIHRYNLQRILAEEVGFDKIKLSKRLSKIERTEKFRLIFEDESVQEVNTIIGADGIKSIVRNQLFKQTVLRNANQKCWRGVCEIEFPKKYCNTAYEAWGKGKRFGFVQINEKNVYWYAVVNEDIWAKGNDNLLELFKEFHTDVLKIISHTPTDQIIFNDIIDLKPIKKWQDQNVCLIGDAAHAMTPNLGQGACQAIEDAYTIGQLMVNSKSLQNVFFQYEKLRIKKVHNIVNASWKIGKLAHTKNDVGIWLRNTIMKNLPDFVKENQLAQIFDISYIERRRNTANT